MNISKLRESRLSEVPEARGVYLILRPIITKPRFLAESPAGWFKGRDPSLAVSELRKCWIPQSPVLYIGKAGSSTNRSTLRSRLRDYLSFGAGRKVGHWGGRMIWQLADVDKLQVAWRKEAMVEPRDVERLLIQDFVKEYGCRPFANRTG